MVGVVARGLEAASGLLLLPLIVARFSPAEVGLWYVFLTLQGLIVLLDFGFQPTIARAFASAFAGARTLLRQGLDTDSHSEPNYPLVREIIDVARRLYGLLSIGVVLLMATGGLAFVWFLAGRDGIPLAEVLPAWLLFSAAMGLTVYLLWISPLLLGAGRVAANYRFLAVNRLTFTVAAAVMLSNGVGLIALPIAVIFGSLAGRLVASASMSDILRRASAFTAAQGDHLLKTLWHNASRMGVISASGFLAIRANVFVVSIYAGLGPSASYSISLQLLTSLMSVSLLPSQILMPRAVAARIRSDQPALQRIFWITTLTAVGVFGAGLVSLLFVGPFLLDLVGSNVNLLPTGLFAILGAIMLLETNHANSSMLIATSNIVPFTKAAIISGLSIAILSPALAWAGLGIAGVILAQGGVQLAYNNWAWPLLAWRQVRD
ncbi:MAG: O-unit flippase-like protein [Brevundimonas sp.]